MSESLEGLDALPDTPVSEADEERLIRACQDGDLEGFDDLVRMHQDRVYGVAYQLLRNHEDAEDITQEVFLSCLRKIGLFRFESRFSTWLYRVTVNLVKNRWVYHRRRQRDRHQSLDTTDLPDHEAPAELPAPGPNPREQAEGHEMLEHLNEAMAALPTNYQEVMTLRFIEHLSYEEISEVLGCSLGTVKSRINRARRELREKLRGVID